MLFFCLTLVWINSKVISIRLIINSKKYYFMKTNLFKLLKLFVQDFAFFCGLKKHEENVVELVNRKAKPKVIFISTTDTKDVSKAREKANSSSKSEVIEQPQQKVGETPQIEETVNVKVEPEMDSVSETTVMEKPPANKTYSPKMIKEANELIYDYFSRYDRERVEKHCKTRLLSKFYVRGEFIVTDFDYQKSVIPKETSFTDDLGADSLLMTDFIMSCEKKYGKTVSDEDYENIKTVADFYDIFERYWFKK